MNHWTAYDRCGPSPSGGRDDRLREPGRFGRIGREEVDVDGHDVAGELLLEAWDVEALHLGEIALGRVGELTGTSRLRLPDPPDDVDDAVGGGRYVDAQRDETTVHDQGPAVAEVQRGDHVLAGAPALRAVDDQELLVVEVPPGDGDVAPLDLVGRAAGEHVVERLGWQRRCAPRPWR